MRDVFLRAGRQELALAAAPAGSTVRLVRTSEPTSSGAPTTLYGLHVRQDLNNAVQVSWALNSPVLKTRHV